MSERVRTSEGMGTLIMRSSRRGLELVPWLELKPEPRPEAPRPSPPGRAPELLAEVNELLLDPAIAESSSRTSNSAPVGPSEVLTSRCTGSLRFGEFCGILPDE